MGSTYLVKATGPFVQMSFLAALHDLVIGGSQLIIATHSPIIMAYPQAWIYHLDQSGLRRVDYKETEHYRVTRDFLLRTDQMLKILMDDAAPRGPAENLGEQPS